VGQVGVKARADVLVVGELGAQRPHVPAAGRRRRGGMLLLLLLPVVVVVVLMVGGRL
jgi:hypothetical protein